MLVCRSLVRSFGERRAVDDLSLNVDAGEAYGLIGPNGAGKTTLIKVVCGLLVPDEGAVTINGHSPTHSRDRAAFRELGYVPQEIALYPTLSLRENLEFWCRLQGVARRARPARITELLELVGLGPRARDRLEHCSGGMQRRVNLAAALLHRPRLLVLDEPTVGVDAQSRASMLEVIGQMRDDGMAVLYTSHYFDEVERLCDRVGIVDNGRLLVENTPGELVAQSSGAADLQSLFLQLTGSGLRD